MKDRIIVPKTAKNSNNSSRLCKKHPPYAKSLIARQRFRNPPFLAVVCVGADAWDSAKKWNSGRDNCAMVLPAGESPSAFEWPVDGCTTLIEWHSGPSPQTIDELIQCLIRAGAQKVIVQPLFGDRSLPDQFYDVDKPLGQRWTRNRYGIQIIKGKPHAQ